MDKLKRNTDVDFTDYFSSRPEIIRNSICEIFVICVNLHHNEFDYLDHMNFLAHLYLSGDDPKIMVGNFIADFVKGKSAPARYEETISFGIELHRSIDDFTDRHSIVKSSKQRLQAKYRHYSGVIVDMFYDHFLASNWDTFHPLKLDAFSAKAYGILQEHNAILPERVNWMLPYMIDGNWLVGYGSIQGIGRALTGMSKRTPFESRMDEATNDLREHYPQFKEEFMKFFPELQAFSTSLIQARLAR